METWNRELDLRGEVCPYTFVKAKLATEELAAGQVLRILLDHLPAVADVPRGLAAQGDDVLQVRQLNESDWEILVRKGSCEKESPC
jgi:tRNA 2-thiouridine synthesizing protein A